MKMDQREIKVIFKESGKNDENIILKWKNKYVNNIKIFKRIFDIKNQTTTFVIDRFPKRRPQNKKLTSLFSL